MHLAIKAASSDQPSSASETLERARSDLDRSLEIRPNHPNTLLHRSQVRIHQKNYIGALEDLGETLRLQPRNRRALTKRGALCLDHLNQPRQAIADFTAALNIDPNDLSTLGDRAKAYRHIGDPVSALRDLDSGVAVAPENMAISYARYQLRHQLKDFEGALADISHVLDLDSYSFELLSNRGQLLMTMRRPREAIADFDAALQIQANLPPALYGRGWCRAELDDLDGAISDFEQLLQLRLPPGMEPEVRAALAEFKRRRAGN